MPDMHFVTKEWTFA